MQEPWADLLAAISQEVTSDESFLTGTNAAWLTAGQRATKWLGQPGASEAALAQLEGRLQQPLPPSYRAFLAASNGFGPIDYFIYNLHPAHEVAWLIEREAELVELWERAPTLAGSPLLADEHYLRYDGSPPEGALRPGHLRQCLLISDWGDAGFLVLNPAVRHEGEWEAWHFANWYPGAVRYRSFLALMEASLASFRELRPPLS